MLSRLVVAAAVVGLVGCAPDTREPIGAIYIMPESLDELDGETWFDHPWPSDLRVEDGAPVFRGFHNPGNVKLVAEYVGAADGVLDGFSPAAPGYVRFDGPIDPTSLPAMPAHSMSHRSSVQVIDIDTTSPEYGTRRPIMTSFRAEPGVYMVSNTLSWLPAFGFPLRPKTRYALVVTHSLRSASGGDVLANDAIKQIVGAAEPSATLRPLAEEYAPAVELIHAMGTRPRAIRHFSVFTTGDPIAETIAVADHLRARTHPPEFIARVPWESFPHNDYYEYRAEYGPLPNYQKGVAPFFQYGDGGGFNFVDGEPQVVDYYRARFSLTVPRQCDQPPEGWPIVLYAHGTGGNYRGFIDNGTAITLAQKCIATMGVDQIFHGERPGTPDNPDEVDILFFNFQNVDAARTNARMSAIDEVHRARLFTETRATIPAHVSHTEKAIRFDPHKVMFFGHSQGGLNGPLYLAVDDSALGGVLSGSGSIITITLLEKTLPPPSIAQLVANVFLALLPEEQGELDVFHPAMMVAQSLIDPVDPINYARLTIREPRPGYAPKSILMTEGITAAGEGDNYTPPRGIEAAAVALGLPLQLPAQRMLEQASYGAPAPIEIPADGLKGNLADGEASGVLAQWPPTDGDGHFVVFRHEAAREQAAEFLRRLAADPTGNVPPP